MTQNNIYMDNENSEIIVNVKPEAEDIVMNAATSAAASAASASVSASAASDLLESIRGIKTGVEIFVAQAIEGLQDLYANLTAQLSTLKDTCVQNVNTAYTSAMQVIRQTETEVLTIIRNLGAGYVNEAAGYARAAQEIVDFHVSTEHLNQSKGLLTGDISDDVTVLSDVKKYAHSTFKCSKFAVIGSPTITADGIASGFSSSNYLTLPLTTELANKTDIVIRGSWVQGSNFTDRQWLFNFYNSSATNESFQVVAYDSGIGARVCNGTNSFFGTGFDTTEIPITTGQKYNFELKIKGTLFTFTVNGVSKSRNGYVPFACNTFIYGGSVNTGFPFQGSSDLKDFSITVDGVPVFSGNKTGLDVIKLDDFSAPSGGSLPTITFDGIASGFSGTSYITIPDLNISNAADFEFLSPYIQVGAISSGINQAINWTSDSGTQFMIINRAGNNFFEYRISQNGTVIGATKITDSIDVNKFYQFKFTYKNQLWNSYHRVKGGDWVQSQSNVADTAGVTITGTRPLGWQNSTQYLQNGQIDLNAFKIYVNGDLVYQPCLRIPYTESKTGSKVVDSYYRDRVSDMASQFGYAPYYTLDEDNGNFTLPMGEVYGMIETLRNKINELNSQT